MRGSRWLPPYATRACRIAVYADGLSASGLDMPNAAIDQAHRLEGMLGESGDPALLDDAGSSSPPESRRASAPWLDQTLPVRPSSIRTITLRQSLRMAVARRRFEQRLPGPGDTEA